MKRILLLVMGLVALLAVACDAIIPLDQPTAEPAPSQATGSPDVATPAPIMLQEATNTPTRARATAPNSGFSTIRIDQLPPEARQTIALIQKGGPFPYRQDGVVFGNREGLLPREASGYYHEYTVVTPGSPDRGARRIITGQNGEIYYTDDHYASFKRIVQ